MPHPAATLAHASAPRPPARPPESCAALAALLEALLLALIASLLGRHEPRAHGSWPAPIGTLAHDAAEPDDRATERSLRALVRWIHRHRWCLRGRPARGMAPTGARPSPVRPTRSARAPPRQA